MEMKKAPCHRWGWMARGLMVCVGGLFACGAVALESSWCGGELVGGYEFDFLGDVEVYLCYAVAYFVGWQCWNDVVEDCHDFVSVAEVDGAERVGEYHSGLVDG